jgi:hypothetical protein
MSASRAPRLDREVTIKIFPELSDGLSVPEKLVILVVPAVAAADVGEVGDELGASGDMGYRLVRRHG